MRDNGDLAPREWGLDRGQSVQQARLSYLVMVCLLGGTAVAAPPTAPSTAPPGYTSSSPPGAPLGTSSDTVPDSTSGAPIGATPDILSHTPAANTGNGVLLATIGETRITTADLEREIARRPGDFSTTEQRQALLDRLVADALAYEAARRAEFDQDPDLVRSIHRLIAKRYLDQALAPKLDAARVTDEDVAAYYAANPSQFTRPARRKAALIRMQVSTLAPPEARERVRARADEARAEALALDPGSAGFGAVAVRYSDHQATRYRGGDIGWMRADDDRWERPVIDALYALGEPGAISQPIETPTGIYLVKLVAAEPDAPLPLAEVRDRIRDLLRYQRRQAIETGFYDALQAQVPTQLFPEALPAVEPPAVDPAAAEQPTPPPLPGTH